MAGRWHDSAGYGSDMKGLPPRSPESKIITGHCMGGSHEGKPTKSPSGLPLKECLYPNHCACDCHVEERQLRSLLKLPDPEFLVPGAPIPARLGAITDISGAILVTHAPDVVKPQRLAHTGPDSSLRTRLEWRMYEVCKRFSLVGAHETEMMTVQFFIGRLGEETSSGAVDAVLKRWAERGFATMGRQPTRFTGFTQKGAEMGLELYLESLRKSK